jgi:hypothetical protein
VTQREQAAKFFRKKKMGERETAPPPFRQR